MPNESKVPDADPLQQLPTYSRSLLKVRLPLRVTLASSKQPVQRVMELAPGVILQFDKAYDEQLTLEAGDRPIAQGEAVKVGDKFGLRIVRMILPQERFWAVKGQPAGNPASDAAPTG